MSSLDEYNQRLNYFLDEAKNNIWLIYDHHDTLKPASYLFETNFNLTPQETIVVGFYLPHNDGVPNSEMQLSYRDQIFKNGIIKVLYKSNVIRNIPQIVY